MRRPATSRRRLLSGVLLPLCAFVLSACAERAPQDYLEPEGPIARRADELWDLTFGIAAVIFFIVEGLLVYALVRFRHRRGREPRQFHGNTKVEVVLTLVPALILAGVAIPTVRAILDLAQRPTGDNVLQVNVTARQFWWDYVYPDLNVRTANEMHVPTDTPVYVTLEGDDVIHSFWIPKLTGKQDVVPGRTNAMQFTAPEPGTYLGQCTEFCGLSHANMRLRVIAHEPSEFQAWVADQRRPAEDPAGGLAAEGRRVFFAQDLPAGGSCVNCHAIAGTDAQATTGPDLTHFASRETFAGAMFQRTDENLANWLRDPPEAKPGARMPDYGLSESQIDALVAYLQTLK